MRLTELARRLPPWLRFACAGLVVAFVLSSIAHVTHRHEALAGSSTDLVACGYCLSFGAMADAKVQRTPELVSIPGDERIIALTSPLLCKQQPCAAQPRGPPVS